MDNDNGSALNYDLNGDGINDSYWEQVDLNGDGINDTDMLFNDSNGDGIFDNQSFFSDVNGDGILEEVSQLDTNGDGYFDTTMIMEDTQGDGAADIISSTVDINGDGIFEATATDVDSDFDGIIDIHYEQQQIDENGDGIIDTVIFGTDTNLDGIFDSVEIYQDTNNDGFLELVPFAIPTDNDYVVPSEYDTMQNFDPGTDPSVVTGEPSEDMQHWEFQGNTNRCALFSQMFAIEELTGQDINIEDFADTAEQHGWFTEDGGTMPDDMNKMLDFYGIDSDMKTGATMDDIINTLDNGGKVIVAVDGDEIWDANHDSNNYAPNDPNHAIEIIGIDNSDPSNPMVIINDSGHPDGCGEMVPVDQFVNAWEDSDFQIVMTK